MQDFARALLGQVADGSFLSLVAIALATLVSEDLACIAAGLLVARGTLGFAPATTACFLGILGGDLGLVLLGRTLGRRSLVAAPLKWWVSAESVSRAEGWFAQRGARLIFTSRFMPGTRLPTYVAAGVLRAPFFGFLGWFVFACAVWTPLLVGLAALVGDRALQYYESWTHTVPLLLTAGLVSWGAAWIAVRCATWRGRRLLWMRWQRLTRWEFWPMWAVYPPVVLYIVVLALRHRGLTLFTVTNPGMGSGGGLVGESKSEILQALSGAGEVVARWRLIAPDSVSARIAAVRTFMTETALEFPIVLKPDVGERGRGVVIARSIEALTEALASEPAALIAQAYVPGIEFGVFYIRRPSAARGEIFAITDKRVVSVTGDGERSLEELILGDDRAVCMASFFLQKHATRLDEIIPPGDEIALSELGTHCRGALFLDGTHLVTPALLDAIERVSRTHDGFYFGRYDIRASSVEAFQAGEFRVIELNGLTSEATSIYDPKHSVWFGWRTLCRQWRLAFEIAAENRARGARPLSLRQTWQLAFSRPSS